MFNLKLLSGKEFRRWYIRVFGLVLLLAIYVLVSALIGWLPALLILIFACLVGLWIRFIIEDLAEKERLGNFR